jgi:ribosomal protein S12 methylthiotransferase accessory factor
MAKAVLAGTHRLVPPAETVARLRPYLAELGITRVANVTGMDDVGIPVAMAVRPNARSLSVGFGKGLDLDAARASAIMEALEQQLAERIDLPLRLASAAELGARRPLVDLARLPRGPRPLGPRTRTLWIEGREVLSGRSAFVPYELVHLDLTLPLPEGSGHFPLGSNGLASGNAPLEAICHGLYELVERDAAALFAARSAAAQASRRVDLATIDDPDARALLGKFDLAGVDVALWDLTTDVGLPVFLCEALDRERNPFRPLGAARGFGCHGSRAVAAIRALTEAAQSRIARILASRDDILSARLDAIAADEADAAHRARRRSPPGPGRRFGDAPDRIAATFEEDLAFACARLEDAGLGPVVAVDLSAPRLPVSVVRVVAPGLEGVAEAPGVRPGPRVRRAAEEAAP